MNCDGKSLKKINRINWNKPRICYIKWILFLVIKSHLKYDDCCNEKAIIEKTTKISLVNSIKYLVIYEIYRNNSPQLHLI